MKKKSHERQMIVFEDLRKYVSIVGTKYRVLGLWSWTQKKLATKIMEKKTWKEYIYFFIKPIVSANYREGRNKIDEMCSFKARSIITQWTHINFQRYFCYGRYQP
jgi:hypothetical protein